MGPPHLFTIINTFTESDIQIFAWGSFSCFGHGWVLGSGDSRALVTVAASLSNTEA